MYLNVSSQYYNIHFCNNTITNYVYFQMVTFLESSSVCVTPVSFYSTLNYYLITYLFSVFFTYMVSFKYFIYSFAIR